MLTNFEKRLLALDVIIAVGTAVVAVFAAMNVSVYFALLGIVPVLIVAADTYRYLQIRKARQYLFAPDHAVHDE